jgi:hypothetical protein
MTPATATSLRRVGTRDIVAIVTQMGIREHRKMKWVEDCRSYAFVLGVRNFA